MKIFYSIYKITNKVNGKIYIGRHKTCNLDDGYMGSGKIIKLALQSYGIENFTKEILSLHETRDAMIAEEKRLVNSEFLKRTDVYNLAHGGTGDWHHIHIKTALQLGDHP